MRLKSSCFSSGPSARQCAAFPGSCTERSYCTCVTVVCVPAQDPLCVGGWITRWLKTILSQANVTLAQSIKINHLNSINKRFYFTKVIGSIRFESEKY